MARRFSVAVLEACTRLLPLPTSAQPWRSARKCHFTRGTGDTDRSPIISGNAPGDTGRVPRTAVFPRLNCLLALKTRAHLFFRHADPGVPHPEAQQAGVAALQHAPDEFDLAFLGESTALLR